MTDFNDGKIHGWNGGECPVHPESEVMVWYRGNTSSAGFCAKLHSWRHGNYDVDEDIIAFQVTKPFVEPKAMWVNVYPNGDLIAYPSEEMAKSWGHSKHSRIAVKYVEAKDE